MFFAAARVCILFHEHAFLDTDGEVLLPAKIQISPMLKETTWHEQALRFLERGRARALWDAIKSNETLMDDNPLKAVPEESIDLAKLGGTVQDTETLTHRPKKPSWDFILDMAPWRDADPQQERPLKKRRVLTDPTNGMTPRVRWHAAKKVILSKLNTDVSTKKILSSIPHDTAVVEYALVSSLPREKIPRSGLIIIVTTSDGDVRARWEDLNRTHIGVRIESLLQSLEEQMTGANRDADVLVQTVSMVEHLERVQRLQNVLVSTLVEPVHELLKNKGASLKRRLIIVPSGDLANVPWSMLFTKEPICVVPSLSIWERLNARNRAADAEPMTAFVTNKPISSKGRVKNIQYARLETLHLAHVHETLPDQADDHDTNSLEELFRGRDLVHLSAHGEFNKLSPMDTSVHILENPLTIWDWYGLKVQAKLVVFSSCLSAVAKTSDSGQGFGFSYALLSTGTRAFIGSLWPVNDEATLLFMMLFYAELRSGLPPADALFKAQADLRELTDDDLRALTDELRAEVEEEIGLETASNFVDNPLFMIERLRKFNVVRLRNPAYWAAFTLVGHGFQPLYPI
jgi:CHAT domain-containing protein